MPQSLHQSHGPIVFSIKNRDPLITGELESHLYAYLGGMIRDLGATPIIINGMLVRGEREGSGRGAALRGTPEGTPPNFDLSGIMPQILGALRDRI